jgi:hypothetical protein
LVVSSPAWTGAIVSVTSAGTSTVSIKESTSGNEGRGLFGSAATFCRSRTGASGRGRLRAIVTRPVGDRELGTSDSSTAREPVTAVRVAKGCTDCAAGASIGGSERF